VCHRGVRRTHSAAFPRPVPTWPMPSRQRTSYAPRACLALPPNPTSLLDVTGFRQSEPRVGPGSRGLANPGGSGLGHALVDELAVDLAPQHEVGRVVDLVRAHQHGADGRAVLPGLALQPLRGSPLPVAHGDVVHDGVAGDGGRRLDGTGTTNPAADHEAELGL